MYYLKIFVFCLFSFVLIFSCTNWKAKYLITKNDLDKCLTTEPKQKTKIEWKKIPGENIVQSDTIYIDEIGKEKGETEISKKQNIETISDFQISDYSNLYYEKQYELSLNKDSVWVWLTIQNQLIGNAFIQTIRIDSVSYPEMEIIKEFTKLKTKESPDKYKSLIWGVLGGVIIAILLLWIFRKR